MSKTQTVFTTSPSLSPLYLRCPKDVVHSLKKVALETDTSIRDVVMQAFMDYLNKNRQLIERKVDFTPRTGAEIEPIKM